MQPLIVAYYTPGPYEAHADELRSTLLYFDLEHEIDELPAAGDWRANAHLRPAYLREKCRRHPGRRLLSLDIDARVRSNPFPALEQIECDAGFHTHIRPNSGGSEPLPGTLLLCPTPRADQLLSTWAGMNEEHPSLNDRDNFAVAIADCLMNEPGLIVGELGVEFTFIFDTHRRMYPGRKPVIEHMQASRRLRKEILV